MVSYKKVKKKLEEKRKTEYVMVGSVSKSQSGKSINVKLVSGEFLGFISIAILLKIVSGNSNYAPILRQAEENKEVIT